MGPQWREGDYEVVRPDTARLTSTTHHHPKSKARLFAPLNPAADDQSDNPANSRTHTVSNFITTTLSGARVQMNPDGSLTNGPGITEQVAGANVNPLAGEGTAQAHKSGSTRVVIGGNGADWSAVDKDKDHQSFSSTTITNGEEGILATATNGRRAVTATELKASDFVTLPNKMEVTVADAVTLGYLRPAASGRGYENTVKGQPAHGSQGSQSANVDPAVAARAAEAAALEKAAATVKGEMADLEAAAFAAADPHNAIAALTEIPLGLAVGVMVKGQRGGEPDQRPTRPARHLLEDGSQRRSPEDNGRLQRHDGAVRPGGQVGWRGPHSSR